MESQIARRRINRIAGHFVPPTSDDIISSTAHLVPMNCSSSLNSAIRRCDNKMYFARQGSEFQACFMRPISSEQSSHNASEAPLFSRPSLPLNCSDSTSSGRSKVPLFSRPATMEPIQHPVQDFKSSPSDFPKFAKPNSINGKQEQFCFKKKNIYSSESNGIEWLPRMDVRELGRNYVMTVEIPGVSIHDIRVEVHEQTLIVMAKRATKCSKVAGCLKGSMSAYHKREYREEPYQIVWPLPIDVNIDTISAEFLNGLLQVIIPKL